MNDKFSYRQPFTEASATLPNVKEISSNDTCVPLNEGYVLAVSTLPCLVIVENLLILLAMFLYRKKLKHNNVYRYVASALIANVVASFLAFYHFINYYYGFESHEPNLWWALRKGMTLALSLILCGNIGLMIYGIEDSTYIVGRISHSKQQSSKLSPKYRKRKANALIFLVWAFPSIYGLLSMTSWNCTQQCTCTLSYNSDRPICSGSACSRVYTPMSKTYLLVIVLLWILECSSLMVVFCKSIYAVKHSNKEVAANGNETEFKYMSLRRTLAKCNTTHRVVFSLFFLFVCCTTPVMTLFILDIVCPEIYFSPLLINLVSPLTLAYCLVSPVLVANKLSGVKRALITALSCAFIKDLTNSRKRRKPSGVSSPSVYQSSRDDSIGVL